jgi:hypothetical protein
MTTTKKSEGFWIVQLGNFIYAKSIFSDVLGDLPVTACNVATELLVGGCGPSGSGDFRL